MLLNIDDRCYRVSLIKIISQTLNKSTNKITLTILYVNIIIRSVYLVNRITDFPPALVRVGIFTIKLKYKIRLFIKKRYDCLNIIIIIDIYYTVTADGASACV